MTLKIDLMIGLFFIIFALTSQLDIYIILMTFALIHEIGHLCAGILLGYRPKEIKINPLGFKMELEEKNRNNNKISSINKAIIAISGPFTNFIIVCSIIILEKINPEVININILNINIKDVIYANILIGIFNLIPVYPLDGGRFIKELLYLSIGLKKSYKYTYLISKTTIIVLTILASIAILFIHNISILLIITYLWIIIITEKTKIKINKAI